MSVDDEEVNEYAFRRLYLAFRPRGNLRRSQTAATGQFATVTDRRYRLERFIVDPEGFVADVPFFDEVLRGVGVVDLLKNPDLL